MWPTTWQLACTVDHLANPGDWYEYRVGQYSVLIVRDDDGELRAYQNVCLHRGNELCHGAGSGLTEIRCAYHRWSWDLQGRLREVPSRKGFGVLRNEDFPLIAVLVDTWGPFVFVNLDIDADPLAEFLAPVPDDIAWAGIDEFRCHALVTVPLPANWKVCIEAFSETYHVQGIHREMLPMCDDVNSPQAIWEHSGRLVQPYGLPSPRLAPDARRSAGVGRVRRGHGRTHRDLRQGRRRHRCPTSPRGRPCATFSLSVCATWAQHRGSTSRCSAPPS